MLYEEFDPPEGASPWIANRWRFAVEAHDPETFEHIIPPDGTLSISVAQSSTGLLGPIVFAGPSTTAHRVSVQRGWSYLGVRLHPAACGPLLRLDAGILSGKIGVLGIVAPAAAQILDSAVRSAAASAHSMRDVLDSAVQELACTIEPPDPAIVRAVDALLQSHGARSVEHVAREVGLSVRQLRRKFHAHVGLSPKEFARVRRLRHACILMLMGDDPRLSGVSLDGGYADQPHLTREFRGMFGSSPRLVEAYLRQIEHVGVKE
jgi:AraC-like DNA-binding protein